MNSDTPRNPYVGARAFGVKEKDFFFGREREALDLLSLVISERLVVFYAQSGAGKSSLINTRLIPGLIEQDEYKILPVGRLLGESNQANESDNIFIYNLVTSLIKQKLNETVISKLTLSQFLSGLDHDDEEGYFFNDALPPQLVESDDEEAWKYVLIIDQFEELFTTHQEQWTKREDFFRQLAGAMEDFPNLWIVLVMREDYVATLDPYAHLVPGKFRGRYYMQRLGHDAAVEAVQGPAAKRNRPFANGVAEKLVNDLSSIKVRKPDNTLEMQAGQYVEPVQLQVVCSSLWEKLPANVTQITQENLDQYVGDVDLALGNYYEERVKTIAEGDVAQQNQVKERDIRDWFGRKLITADGIRNMVAQERGGHSGGLDDDVVQEFVKRGDLVRSERRGGATFYELTHDRLVEPILENNTEWFNDNSSLLQKQAALWLQQGRNNALLLRGKALRTAAKEADTLELTTDEQAFLTTSRVSERNRTISWIAVGIALLTMALLSYTAIQQSLLAAENEKRAEESAALALHNQETAEENEQIALAAQQQAVLQANRAQAISLSDRDFSESLLLAIELFKVSDNTQTRGLLLDSAQTNPQLLQYLGLHNKNIYSVAFSPDGGILASASADWTISLWDTESHLPIGRPLTGHQGSVTSVAFSPDGRILASGSKDKTIILWDVESQQPIGQSLTGHTETIYSVAFSPDGRTLASSSADRTIILWDVESGQPIGQPLSGHKGPVISVGFSPDGKTLISGSEDAAIILWDVESQPVRFKPLIAHGGAITGIAFSPDGQILASSSVDQSIILWDTKDWSVSGTLFVKHQGYVTDIEFSPDGKTLASSGVDRTIIIWDVASRQQRGEPLRGHSDWVRSVAFSPDGTTLASGGADDMVILWSVGAQIPLGQWLAGHQAAVYTIAFSPENGILASAGADRTIILWDTEKLQPIGPPRSGHKRTINSIVFDQDGKFLASGSSDGTIIIWDIETLEPVGQPLTGHTDSVYSVAFSPDGRILASGAADNLIILWDMETQQPIGPALQGHAGAVNSLAFSPDGKILASGSADRTIILWNLESHEPIGQPLSGHEGIVYSVAFSPDGRTLASGGEDNQVILWDTVNGQPITSPLTYQIGPIYAVAFSPDGKTLASGGYKNSVLLWDVESNSPIGEPFIDNTLTISSLAFSPDGKSLASGSDNKNIILWDLNPQNWIQKICQRVGRNFSREEWMQYFPDEDYRKTCDQWPLESEVTANPTP